MKMPTTGNVIDVTSGLFGLVLIGCGAWYWYNNNVQAHSTKQIAETAAREGLPVAPMKPSDAREILTRSCKIAEVLHRVVNGKSFSFDDSRGMHRENAESLWTGCRFNIAR